MGSEDETPVPFGKFRPGERRALIGCSFATGCVLLMPQELVSAGIAFTAAGILALWHLRKSRQEAAEAAEAEAKARLAAAADGAPVAGEAAAADDAA